MGACTETGGKKGRGSIVSIGFNEVETRTRGGEVEEGGVPGDQNSLDNKDYSLR